MTGAACRPECWTDVASGVVGSSPPSLVEYHGCMAALLNTFDRPVNDAAVTGERDSNGRTFLDVAFEQVSVEADTLALLAER